MARSKKKSSARAASAAKARAVEPAADDLDELTTTEDPTLDEAGEPGVAGDAGDAGTADDTGTAGGAGTAAAAGKDPVKRSRANAAKDPVRTKGSRKATGKDTDGGTGSGKNAGKNAGKGSDKAPGSGTTSGSEISEKAKDATRSTSPKKAAAAETARTGRRRVAAEAPNPAWLAPTAVVFLILGLIYLVTFYLSSGTLPLPIGDWNLAAGFGVMLVGGGMLMFWK